jgi:hypothetical protein
MDYSGAESDDADLTISFQTGGVWSDPVLFYNASVSGELHTTKSATNRYGQPEFLPDKVKLIANDPKMNDWGYWQMVLTYTCDIVLAQHPEGSTGDGKSEGPNFWLGDGASTEVEWAVPNPTTTCSPTPPPTYGASVKPPLLISLHLRMSPGAACPLAARSHRQLE